MMLGIHMATSGDVMPETANEDVTVMKRMYEKLSIRPIPIFTPMPPLTFLEDNDIPMTVRIKAAAHIANRF